MTRIDLKCLFLVMAISWSHAWSLTRRQLLIGTAGAGTAAIGAVIAKAVNGDPEVYTPAPGSLLGQTIVVTGGTTGLGLESVKRLAVGGAHVILTARSVSKGEKAVEEVQEYLTGRGIVNPNVSFKVLDLDNLQSVKEVTTAWQDIEKIDVLLNNAGVMAVPEVQLTGDGYEKHMQSNHLGHFALTALLAPKLATNARIINVSSRAHKFASIGLQEGDALWKPDPSNYSPFGQYGQSKLANILFTEELQRRINAAGLGWTTVSLHPGAIPTDLGRYIVGEDKWSRLKEGKGDFLTSALANVLSIFLKPIPQGANTQVWLAARADQEANVDVRGQYLADRKIVPLASFATDTVAASRLWKESEEKAGISFKL